MQTQEHASLLVWVSLGFVFFTGCDHLLRPLVPSCASKTSGQAWKWKNTAVSFVHSFITGIWSLLCFYLHPRLGADLINVYTRPAHMLVCFSIGYFIHDCVDMVVHHRKRSTYELLVHHACVISCFGLAAWTRMFLGYAVVALFVEVNSVFLHLRQLLNISGVGKDEPVYRVNSICNIATFIVFRIAVLGWMTRWLVLHKDDLSLAVYTLGSIAMAIIMLMSIVLFCRIYISDFTKKKHKDVKSSDVGLKEGEDMLRPTSPTKLLPNGTNVHLE